MAAKRIYYSARQGNYTRRFDLSEVKEFFLDVYEHLEFHGYFQEALGYECVDEGLVLGTVGANIGLYVFRTVKKRHLWPINNKTIQDWTEIDLFDAIELLHDLASSPIDGYFHDFANCGWHYSKFDKDRGQLEFRNKINDILIDYDQGFELLDSGQIVPLSDQQMDSPMSPPGSTFDSLFPLGLPVSVKKKPMFVVEQSEVGQQYGFEENNQVGVLRGDIYPNFCMCDVASWIDTDVRLGDYAKPEVPFDKWQSTPWTVLYNLCQSPAERAFLSAYIIKFVLPYKRPKQNGSGYSLSHDLLRDKVPALIPQVWTRWNSETRDSLKRMGYGDQSLSYRLDFVAFWNSRNFVVMIDDISHYAVQVGPRWDANEEKYAARLKEDRLLRIQGWSIFRVGNWEVKDVNRLDQVLNEWRKFVGFVDPPVLDEDIPF